MKAQVNFDSLGGGGNISSATCSGIDTISANSSATIPIDTNKIYAITCWCPSTPSNRYSGGAVIYGDVTQTFRQSSGAEISKGSGDTVIIDPDSGVAYAYAITEFA